MKAVKIAFNRKEKEPMVVEDEIQPIKRSASTSQMLNKIGARSSPVQLTKSTSMESLSPITANESSSKLFRTQSIVIETLQKQDILRKRDRYKQQHPILYFLARTTHIVKLPQNVTKSNLHLSGDFKRNDR